MNIYRNIVGKVFVPRAAKPRLKELRRGSPGVRTQAVQALGKFSHPKVVESLIIDGLRDPDDAVRKAAIDALAGIGDAAVKPLVLWSKYHLIHREPWEKSDLQEKWAVKPAIALEAFEKIGTPSIDFLLELLKNKKCSYRKEVVEALGRIGDARAVSLLIEILENPSEYDLRNAAGLALGWIGDSQAVEPLIEKLWSISDPWIQRDAARALGDIGDTRAIEPLTTFIKGLFTSEESVKVSAALALERIENRKR